jgi:hypothetical protein
MQHKVVDCLLCCPGNTSQAREPTFSSGYWRLTNPLIYFLVVGLFFCFRVAGDGLHQGADNTDVDGKQFVSLDRNYQMGGGTCQFLRAAWWAAGCGQTYTTAYQSFDYNTTNGHIRAWSGAFVKSIVMKIR